MLFTDDINKNEHKFIKNKTYYGPNEIVYEFNLPSGHSCPGALACKVKVDRKSGKFMNDSIGFRCYAAMPNVSKQPANQGGEILIL